MLKKMTLLLPLLLGSCKDDATITLSSVSINKSGTLVTLTVTGFLDKVTPTSAGDVAIKLTKGTATCNLTTTNADFTGTAVNAAATKTTDPRTIIITTTNSDCIGGGKTLDNTAAALTDVTVSVPAETFTYGTSTKSPLLTTSAGTIEKL